MKKLLVSVVMTAFVATVLFLLGLLDGSGAGGNRFVDLGNGTVRDTSTGLIWLKNTNCFGTKAWQDAMDTAASLADGQCGLTDGSVAGDWRLPTGEEWGALLDTNYHSPALSNAAGTGQWSEGDAFINVQSSYYWSSTTSEAHTDYAWYAFMQSGQVRIRTKTYSLYVWPVRGGN